MNSSIEFRHLRYFLAVAETQHFTRAAEKLGIAQPPLSQQIRRLEEILGHPLFDRTTRGVKLTPAGKLLAQRARGTLAKVRDDLDRVQRVGRGEEGTLTIGFSGSAIFTRLSSVLATFQRHYPNVELRLLEMWTSHQIPALQEGTLDVGFLRDGEPTPGLRLENVLTERYMAVLPETHRLTAKQTLRPADLADEPFILFSKSMGSLAYDRTIACCEREGFHPRIVQEAPQWGTAIRLVSAGLGVTLVPACLRNMKIAGATYRSIRSTARTTLEIAVNETIPSPQAENFIQLARKRMKH
jgi:DNA-binding transcriptional LysR family regulator